MDEAQKSLVVLFYYPPAIYKKVADEFAAATQDAKTVSSEKGYCENLRRILGIKDHIEELKADCVVIFGIGEFAGEALIHLAEVNACEGLDGPPIIVVARGEYIGMYARCSDKALNYEDKDVDLKEIILEAIAEKQARNGKSKNPSWKDIVKESRERQELAAAK